MKRIMKCLLFCLACIVISCDKIMPDFVDDVNYIRFADVVTAPSTRSHLIRNTFPEGSSFGVFGYCVPYILNTTTPDFKSGITAWNVKKVRAYPDVFYNQFVLIGPNNQCSYTAPKQWYQKTDTAPDAHEFQYTFFAYYPYSKSAGIHGSIVVLPETADKIGCPTVSYSCPYSGNNTATILDDELMDDFMFASRYDMFRKEKYVDFKFKHVMTSLDIRLVNHNLHKSVTVKSIDLVCKDCYQNVTVDLDKAVGKVDFLSYGPARYSGTFKFLTKPQTLAIPVNQDKVEFLTKNIMLIPNVNPNEAPLAQSLTLNITYNAGGGKDIIFKHTIPTSFRPFPGINYTLTVDYVGNEFVVNIVAENDEIWNDGGDSELEIM